MRTIEARVNGEECRGWFPETEDELRGFRDWLVKAQRRGHVAVDSETTGLNVYAPDFRVRLVQFGTATEGWLIPVEWGGQFRRAVVWALRTAHALTIHNAPFDGLAFDREGFISLDDLFAKVTDTKILAHLYDSRPFEEGGIGTSLKPLSVAYVDPGADDGQKALVKIFNASGWTKETGWAHIDIRHPDYQRYALLDVLLGSRILPILTDKLTDLGTGKRLGDYEHEIARIGAVIQRKGMLIDAPYTTHLRDELMDEKGLYLRKANAYGVTSVDAPAQVGAALVGMGEELTERTEKNQLSVGKEVLLPLADLDKDWHRIGAREPNPLADAVLRSKRAGKWAKSYADAMLNLRDANGRIHPHTNTMGARTARWSVSNPPLQQLPSSDWRIRRCVIAEPGHVIIASDFAQVELRVLVALANATSIVREVNNGADLHTLTTRMVFGIGPEVTDAQLKNDPRRKLCKIISLGKAYAGGIKTLARQTGLPVEQVKQAVGQYDRALPAIRRYGKKLTREAFQNGMTVLTPSGRTLRLSRDKAYTAIAYMCQSSARDILGQALLEMDGAGILDHVIGVVHDEVIGSVPATDAEEIAREFGRCMDMPFFGVNIESEPEIYGDNWGMGYKGPAREAA
ncbi:DNA polymerase [Actinomadura fulvescens]|uniref:DNA polymerase I n=1 Tax=Actinomadura fulvescens TaxID=46160 RepID=A0ABN3PZU4_9ACTN